MYIGIGLIIILSIFKPKLMDVKLDKIAKFLAFMAIITVFRVSLNSYLFELDPINNFPAPPWQLMGMSKWRFGMVFWEDAIFAIPMVFLFKYMKKWITIPLVIGLSLLFASGHMYQGWWAVGITAFYPYFVSYRFGIKVGFGTVMVCHILYDFITVYTEIFLPYLV